jgi:hypothetical protein
MTKETYQMMYESGCRHITVGLESLTLRMLRLFNKKTFPEFHLTNLENAHEAGILIGGSFIIGHPQETEEDIDALKEFLKENKNYLDRCHLNILEPASKRLVEMEATKESIKKAPELKKELFRHVRDFKAYEYAVDLTEKSSKKRLLPDKKITELNFSDTVEIFPVWGMPIGIYFKILEEDLNLETGKKIEKFFENIHSKNTVIYLSRPLPYCIFNDPITYYTLNKNYFTGGCLECKALLKEGDNIKLCNGEIKAENLFTSREDKLKYIKNQILLPQLPEKCKKCTYLNRGQCNGLCMIWKKQ